MFIEFGSRTAYDNLLFTRRTVNQVLEVILVMSTTSGTDAESNPLAEFEEENDHVLVNKTAKSRRCSKYWAYFDIDHSRPSQQFAICRFCLVPISYRSSVTNLGKHLKKKHTPQLQSNELPEPLTLFSNGIESNKDHSKDWGTESKKDHPRDWSRVLLYFDKIEGQEDMRCKACCQEFSSKDATSLLKHAFSHNKQDFAGKDSESDNLRDESEEKPQSGKRSKSWKHFTVVDKERQIAKCKICRNVLKYTHISNLTKHVARMHRGNKEFKNTEYRNHVWAYFKCIDEAMQIACCLICKKRVIYSDDCTELKRHLNKRHTNIDLDASTFDKTFMVTDNGELYEVDVSKSEPIKQDDAPDELQNDITNEVYLDDSTYEEPEQKTEIHTKRKPSYASNTSPKKIKIPTTPKKEVEEEDSIDIFGKYIVALLKKLPKKSADRLQYEFVRQVYEARNEMISAGTMTEDTRIIGNERGTS